MMCNVDCFTILLLCLIFTNPTDSYRSLLRKEYMTGKVVGGISVPISMYPHVARINIRGVSYCGGSIISDRVVITAAHCVVSGNGKLMPVPELTVVVGSSHLESGFVYKVCKILPYPKYSPNAFQYDLGLVSVKTKFKFGPVVQKILLPKNEHWRNEKYTLTMAGFGVIMAQGAGVPPSLLSTRLRYIDSETCNKTKSSLPFDILVPDHVICLIGEKWSGDCYGDSGSGIVWKRYIVGIVSVGRDAYCGSDILPSMYTNVYYFRHWIRKEVKELESSRVCTRR